MKPQYWFWTLVARVLIKPTEVERTHDGWVSRGTLLGAPVTGTGPTRARSDADLIWNAAVAVFVRRSERLRVRMEVE